MQREPLAVRVRMANKFLLPDWAFGNTDSDADACHDAAVMPLDHRVFFQLTDPPGGRRIEAYAELLAETQALPPVCQ